MFFCFSWSFPNSNKPPKKRPKSLETWLFFSNWKNKKRQNEIAYLENLKDWCAETGLNPEIYLEGIETLRKEFKHSRDNGAEL